MLLLVSWRVRLHVLPQARLVRITLAARVTRNSALDWIVGGLAVLLQRAEIHETLLADITGERFLA